MFVDETRNLKSDRLRPYWKILDYAGKNMSRTSTRTLCLTLRPFARYEENKVLVIGPQGSYSHPFIFCAAFEWAQQAGVLFYTRTERLAKDKRLSLTI
jgi:hypothetical protein